MRGEGYCAGLLSFESMNSHNAIAISGTAVKHNGQSASFTALNGSSQQSLLETTLYNSGPSAAEVEVCEAHGTGTALGDPIEAGAASLRAGNAHNAAVALCLAGIKANIGRL